MKIIRFIAWFIAIIAIAFICGELYLKRLNFGTHFQEIGASATRPGAYGQISGHMRHYIYPQDSKKRPKRALMIGCSFTYGFGVEYQESFVWKLNERIPDCTFVNGGMIGSGPYGILVALDESLKREKYDLVIYSAIVNHIYREGMLHYKQLSHNKIAHTYMAPEIAGIPSEIFALEENDKSAHSVCFYWRDITLPGDSQFRIMNFIRNVYIYGFNTIRYPGERRLRNARVDYMRNKYMHILRAMNSISKAHGSRFASVALAGFNHDYSRDTDPRIRDDEQHDMHSLSYYAHHPLWENDRGGQYPVLDAVYPVDYMTSPELHTIPKIHQEIDRNGKTWQEEDRGDHPSAIVHTYYADKIANFIKENNLLDK